MESNLNGSPRSGLTIGPVQLERLPDGSYYIHIPGPAVLMPLDDVYAIALRLNEVRRKNRGGDGNGLGSE